MLLTYCFIMVYGYITREIVDIVVTRFVLIAICGGVSLAINTFIYPIWAGQKYLLVKLMMIPFIVDIDQLWSPKGKRS